jgi:hypothetical protein
MSLPAITRESPIVFRVDDATREAIAFLLGGRTDTRAVNSYARRALQRVLAVEMRNAADKAAVRAEAHNAA